LNIRHTIFILRDTEVTICTTLGSIKERRWSSFVCIMYNIISIKERRWSSFKYYIVYTAIVRHNSETMYSQPRTKTLLPMPSFVICTQLTEYFSTRCLWLSKNVWNIIFVYSYWVVKNAFNNQMFFFFWPSVFFDIRILITPW